MEEFIYIGFIKGKTHVINLAGGLMCRTQRHDWKEAPEFEGTDHIDPTELEYLGGLCSKCFDTCLKADKLMKEAKRINYIHNKEGK